MYIPHLAAATRDCAVAWADTPAYGSAYHTREQNEFLKLCTRGLTVMVASGDAGATSDGHGGGACELAPSYPGSSSWVTSVSATVQSAVAPKRANGGVGEAAISIATGEFWTTGAWAARAAAQGVCSACVVVLLLTVVVVWAMCLRRWLLHDRIQPAPCVPSQGCRGVHQLCHHARRLQQDRPRVPYVFVCARYHLPCRTCQHPPTRPVCAAAPQPTCPPLAPTTG